MKQAPGVSNFQPAVRGAAEKLYDAGLVSNLTKTVIEIDPVEGLRYLAIDLLRFLNDARIHAALKKRKRRRRDMRAEYLRRYAQ